MQSVRFCCLLTIVVALATPSAAMPIAARRVLILDNLVPERLVRTVRSAPPHPKVELVSAKPKNIFNEYLSRELYQCTSQYVETLAQLQSFIKVSL